jgi:formylglycine-generating enzyme required for sulfatase activity
VDAFPESESDYGVVDMLGNAWEYTTTNFYSRHEMYPVFNHVSHTSHENLAENHDAYPVIRGGAWSSIPEMTTTVYRGKDLLTDRHNEIGFRCIKRIE